MEMKSFFTSEFYEDPFLTVNILNELVEADHVADMDMYQSGEFLFMEAYENDVTKNLLGKVIADLEAYKAYNAECFTTDETTQIGLCALVDEHDRFFDPCYAVRWDAEEKSFRCHSEF